MDDATDGQNLLTKKDVIDFQFAESTLSPKTPFVVACIPAFNEEATMARVVLLAERYVDQVFVCDDGSIIGWFVHDSYNGAFFYTW